MEELREGIAGIVDENINRSAEGLALDQDRFNSVRMGKVLDNAGGLYSITLGQFGRALSNHLFVTSHQNNIEPFFCENSAETGADARRASSHERHPPKLGTAGRRRSGRSKPNMFGSVEKARSLPQQLTRSKFGGAHNSSIEKARNIDRAALHHRTPGAVSNLIWLGPHKTRHGVAHAREVTIHKQLGAHESGTYGGDVNSSLPQFEIKRFGKRDEKRFCGVVACQPDSARHESRHGSHVDDPSPFFLDHSRQKNMG